MIREVLLTPRLTHRLKYSLVAWGTFFRKLLSSRKRSLKVKKTLRLLLLRERRTRVQNLSTTCSQKLLVLSQLSISANWKRRNRLLRTKSTYKSVIKGLLSSKPKSRKSRAWAKGLRKMKHIWRDSATWRIAICNGLRSVRLIMTKKRMKT